MRQGRIGKVFTTLTIAMSAWGPLGLAAAHAQQQRPYTSLKEMRERGVVMQEWETSCAAASLATVLTYGFRDAVSERHIVSRMLEKSDAATIKAQGGFSLLDMKQFVEQRGYEGRAFKDLSFNDLKVFHAPIVPINAHGYNHYVVFNGVQGDDVLLADPAFGNRKMRLKRFIQVWMEGMAFVVTVKAKNDTNAD